MPTGNEQKWRAPIRETGWGYFLRGGAEGAGLVQAPGVRRACRRQAAAGGAEPRRNRLKRRFALRAVGAFALSKPLC